MFKQLCQRSRWTLVIAAFIAIAASAQAQGGHVTEVILKADRLNYDGPCPLTVHFSGYIKTDGPADVKYVFTRNDGATMEPIVLSFSEAGVQRVEGTWKLGDSRVLPRYAGWEAIKILSPNETESSHPAGSFKLACGKPNGQPQTDQPPPNQPPGQARASIRAESVAPFLNQLVAQRKEKFDQELVGLKSLSDRYAPALAAAQQKLGLNAEAMRTDFRAAAQTRDPAQRLQQMALLQAKYKQQLTTLEASAGVNTAALRPDVLAVLTHPNMRAMKGERAVILIEGDPRRSDPPPPPAPDMTEQIFSAPYTHDGTVGEPGFALEADARVGRLFVDTTIWEGSIQKVAFISQDLPVEPGVQRVSVFASFDPLEFGLGGICFIGYISSEAIVNLHVLEGSHEVCGERVSLGRMIAAVIGGGGPDGTEPVQLQCEFTRANPSDATTYSLVASVENWAGAGGLGTISHADIQINLQQFHVYQYRH